MCMFQIFACKSAQFRLWNWPRPLKQLGLGLLAEWDWRLLGYERLAVRLLTVGELLRATFCSGALLRQPSHRVVSDPFSCQIQIRDSEMKKAKRLLLLRRVLDRVYIFEWLVRLHGELKKKTGRVKTLLSNLTDIRAISQFCFEFGDYAAFPSLILGSLHLKRSPQVLT